MKVEMIVAIAALITSFAAIGSSIAAFSTMRATLQHLQAQSGKTNAEAKKTHSEIEWERLDLVVKYWKELSDSVSQRLTRVEEENAKIKDRQGWHTRAFEYMTEKVIGQYPEVVRVARDIWDGKIAGGA